MEPEPALSRAAAVRFNSLNHRLPRNRAAWPGADREEVFEDGDAVAVHVQIIAPRPLKPRRDEFLFLRLDIPIMITRRNQEWDHVADAVQVLHHDHNLGVEVCMARQVEEVPGDYDEVELARGVGDPVVLLEVVVEITYQENSHGRSIHKVVRCATSASSGTSGTARLKWGRLSAVIRPGRPARNEV